MWSDKSKSDVLAALASLERGAAALHAQLQYGEATPDEVLVHLKRFGDYIEAARCAAEWDASR